MPTKDEYSGQDSVMTSARKWPTITPNDDNDLDVRPKAIMVGLTGGNVVLVDEDGNEATVPFDAGEIKPLRPVRVKESGTTATPIHVLI